MKTSILRTLSLLSVILLPVIQSCGSSSSKSEHKQIKLYVDGGNNSSYRSLFQTLAKSYNQALGLEALLIADTPETANSLLLITPGVQARDGKIGWGQSITNTVTSRDSVVSVLQLAPASKDVYYSMRIEFDKDYIDKRMFSDNPKYRYDLKKLFAHEVGHGFQLGHSPNRDDVMYENIDGNKNFQAYYEQVRLFFSQN